MTINNLKNLQGIILDIREQLEMGRIKIIPVNKYSKTPQDKDYYNKTYSLDDLSTHEGNFGIIVGANHTDSSLAIIDIDGYKLNDENSEEYAKVKQQTTNFIFECLKDIPGTMHIRTQSGGYHIYIWNKTVSQHIHETSNNLHFPNDYEIEELAGKSLGHAIEIYTKDKSRQCILPGSSIKNKKTGKLNTYELIGDINKLSDMDTIDDVNQVVKDTLVKHGFIYKKHKAKCFEKIILDDELKELSNDEIKQVANLIIPMLQSINGAKHKGSLSFGGFFSKNITKKSAEAICDIIIDNIGDIFISTKDFKKTVLKNYDRDCNEKTGLPTFVNIVKKRNPNFNEEKFFFEIGKICNEHMTHTIKISAISNVKTKYLEIDYNNNTISTYILNRNKDNEFITNSYVILNLAPISIQESYNILDKNASPQLCLTFYRNGMPHKQTIKGDDIESLEKQLAKRPGIVLKPREYRGVLNEIINEYIKLDQIEITEEIPIEGIFINPINGKLCRCDDKGNTSIYKPSKESVQEALTIWAKLKEVYPHDTKKLAHILRYGLICPFSYILKTEYDWIRMLFLYGSSQTSKTTLAEIALCPYTTISEEVSIGGGSFDTPYRIGKALSRQGTGVIINEPSPEIEKGEPREIIKRAVESKYSREKDDKGEHIKIPAYSNMIFTSNSFMPTHDAYVRRSQYLEFTKKERLNDKQKKRFKKEFHHKNWNNTDFLKLRAIGDFIVWHISENLDVLSLDYADIINNMLDALLDYAEEDQTKWDWMYHDTELMDIDSADNEVKNQFRRMVLHDHKRLNQYSYIASQKNESAENYYERTFKESFLEALQKRSIDYLHYQQIDDKDYIIVNTSVKDALNDFCGLQITCKGLAGYMDCKYTTMTYKNKSIKGFRLSYDDFSAFLDVSG